MNAKNAEEFLQELAELSRKHKIAIGGCGCCGSPWLYYEEGDDFSKMTYDGKVRMYEQSDLFSLEEVEFDYPERREVEQ